MIGMFDSGVGGLTVLRAIANRIPSADVLYFGDTAHAPYGSRSRQELSHLTVEGIRRLQKGGATKIVSACNSVSASLAVSLFDALSLAPRELIEMVGPTVAAFKGSSAKVALVATPATIESGIYQNGFEMIGKEITAVAIPDLAGAIERGDSEEVLEKIIGDVAPALPQDSDVIVLACTHYPLALPVFERVFPGVVLFDPAEAVAERVEKEWWPQEVGNGTLRFLISKDSPHFRALAEKLFPGGQYTIEVVQ